MEVPRGFGREPLLVLEPVGTWKLSGTSCPIGPQAFPGLVLKIKGMLLIQGCLPLAMFQKAVI